MGHGKESPRQKMIGMMYLVLTALLALNVQREVLDAFALVDEGLGKTTKNFVDKNKEEYNIIEAAAAKNAAKAKWNNIAIDLKKQSNELIELIQTTKIDLVNLCDGKENLAVHGKELHPEKVASKDNMDKTAQMMLGETGNGKGKEIKKKMEALRKFMLDVIDPKYKSARESIEKSLETHDPPAKDGVTESWESEHYEHIPLAAVLTILSAQQGNVRNAEAEMLAHLKFMLDAGATKFNKLEAAIIPNTNYVMSGNDYVAKIFIAASDSTQKTKVMIGDYEMVTKSDGEIDYKMKGSFDSVSKYESGKAIYQVRAGSVGNKKVRGLIEIGSGDEAKHVPINLEYTVGEPAVIVSPTKMNVFYIGVDNPVEISIPGVGGDKIFPSINNGTISRATKGYIVKVSKQGTADVSVAADMGSGKKNMGSRPFRVKMVPDPIAKIAGIKGSGMIEKSVLMAQSGVVADLENFDFELKFKVSTFRISATVNGFEKELKVNGSQFNDQVTNFFKGLSKAQKVYFDEIFAVGPGGDPRKLGSLILTLR